MWSAWVSVPQAVEECCRGPGPRESAELLVTRVKEGGLSEEGLLQVLQALKQGSPSLEQLLARVQTHQDTTEKHPGEAITVSVRPGKNWINAGRSPF